MLRNHLITWYSNVSNIVALKTLPAANGRRNMNAMFDPRSFSTLKFQKIQIQ